jgi:hypothetical protein
MRTVSLLPLAALVAVAAGCGSDIKEPATRSVPQRDLTLVTPTPDVQIASPVETGLLRIQPRTRHSSQWAARPAPTLRSSREPNLILASLAVPAPVLAAPAAEPSAQPATPADDRELLPGKTVTVIPVSSGPSIDTDRTDELPGSQGRPMGGGGGGTCRGGGRGPGIGISGAPSPDFR